MALIPTNVVTGFLGVGKTTAVLDLLARKGNAERWAVLVNEYGEVSIDEAILSAGAPEGVTVRDVSGGCVCCASAPYLPVALHLLLTESRPHRLIVETTGLGHPGRLIETLRGPAYADRLDVRSTLTLVSPEDFQTPGMRDNPVFREQIELADVLILNKRDRATESVVAEFQHWANDLYPPKALIVATEYGHLDPAWLDLVIRGKPQTLLMADAGDEPASPGERTTIEPSLGQPVRQESQGDAAACGWRFHPADCFDEARLLALVMSFANTRRLKGLFHLSDGDWILVNRVGGSTTVTPTAYRSDSRLELFADDSAIDWAEFERRLMACLALATEPVAI